MIEVGKRGREVERSLPRVLSTGSSHWVPPKVDSLQEECGLWHPNPSRTGGLEPEAWDGDAVIFNCPRG
jgi:hypothetical protein